jgi:ribosome biogenesis GTPase
MEGIITKNISNDYVVSSNDREYVCKARGKIRYDKMVPLVGDIVSFDDKTNYILSIKKRKNSLVRPSVSNVDQAIVITSVKHPDLDTNLLDRLLTIISYNDIVPVICFTKLDLLSDEERVNIDRYINYYKSIGYKVYCNDDVIGIKKLFKGKLTVFTGQSGAGKSSLLNRLDSSLELKTNEISMALGRGKHTTRHVELFKIEEGYVVDTPGFSSVDFRGMSKLDIRDNMKEMFDNLEFCKYRDCLHIKEDGCYVRKLVEDGKILRDRYDNYKSFIESKE